MTHWLADIRCHTEIVCFLYKHKQHIWYVDFNSGFNDV